APVYCRNELSIDAPAAVVFAHLVRAAKWSEWYSNCKRLRFENGPGPDLALGTRFTWTTFNARIDSTVRELVADERIAWDAKGLGARGYHGWVIEPTASGCHVVTEETQRGWGIRLVRRLLRASMLVQHQKWLEGLARMA